MKTRTMTPMLGAVLLGPVFLTMAGCAGDPSGSTPGDLPESCTGPISRHRSIPRSTI